MQISEVVSWDCNWSCVVSVMSCGQLLWGWSPWWTIKQHPLTESHVRKLFDIGSSLWEISCTSLGAIIMEGFFLPCLVDDLCLCVCCVSMRCDENKFFLTMVFWFLWGQNSNPARWAYTCCMQAPYIVADHRWVWWLLVVVSLKARLCGFTSIHQ